MAAINTTTHAAFLPDLWSKMSMPAFEEALVTAKRVSRWDSDVKTKGDVLNIPRIENLTTAAVGGGGTYSGQANTNTAYTITINRWREASVEIDDIVKAQSAYNLLDAYSKKIGYALGLDVEDQVLGLYSGLANSVGSSGVAVTDDTLLNAIQILDEGVCPQEDRTLIFRPASKRTLMKIDKFVDAAKTGLAKGAQITGLFGEIYGTPIFFSNRVTSSSGIRNLLFHKQAFGLAIQINMAMEKFRLSLQDDLVGHILYGFSELADDSVIGTAACQIIT